MRGPLDLENQLALLLTASVEVNRGISSVTAVDARTREAEYAENLRYLLSHHPRIRKIIFAESSGWPLDRFQELARENPWNPWGKEVEFLQLACNDFPP
ncbi:MAG TPA: hypothetical protein VMM92_05590, partial [Thermoanaerobaculia bacterium]|nr:hypothetical protein [Thermoanaerobaculia bacterium]